MSKLKDRLMSKEPVGFNDYENELLEKKYFTEEKYLDDQEMQQEGEGAERDNYQKTTI